MFFFQRLERTEPRGCSDITLWAPTTTLPHIGNVYVCACRKKIYRAFWLSIVQSKPEKVSLTRWSLSFVGLSLYCHLEDGGCEHTLHHAFDFYHSYLLLIYTHSVLISQIIACNILLFVSVCFRLKINA